MKYKLETMEELENLFRKFGFEKIAENTIEYLTEKDIGKSLWISDHTFLEIVKRDVTREDVPNLTIEFKNKVDINLKDFKIKK